MKKNTGLTVHDIARLAGVSAMTVSRAFNHPDQVSAGTLARVRDVVGRTGFVPNAMAGSLRTSRAKLVAALLPTLTGPVFQETIRALNQALDARGYQLMIGQSGYADSREDRLLDAIIRRRPDGIVLTGIQHSANTRRRLLSCGIPVVETWDLTPTPIDMVVGFSHERVGEALCRYLHGRGYRRPAVLSADDERALQRLQALRHTAQALGLGDVPALLMPAPTTLGCGRRGLGELLALHARTDVLVCTSDLLALGSLIEARARGIAVPARMGVIGFGDLDFAADLDPPLTTVRIDGQRIGQVAAEFIIARAEGREVTETIVDLGFQMIARGSC